MTDTPRPTNPYPEIKGHRCPACGGSLFVGEGGYITCSWYRCPSPDYEIVLAGLGERLAAAEAAAEPVAWRKRDSIDTWEFSNHEIAGWEPVYSAAGLAAAEREGAEKERERCIAIVDRHLADADAEHYFAPMAAALADLGEGQ